MSPLRKRLESSYPALRALRKVHGHVKRYQAAQARKRGREAAAIKKETNHDGRKGSKSLAKSFSKSDLNARAMVEPWD